MNHDSESARGITRLDCIRAAQLGKTGVAQGSYEEFFQYLRGVYMAEDNIRRVAHAEWERDGKPDGEQPCRITGLKLKDMHWFRATLILDMLVDMDARTIWNHYGPNTMRDLFPPTVVGRSVGNTDGLERIDLSDRDHLPGVPEVEEFTSNCGVPGISLVGGPADPNGTITEHQQGEIDRMRAFQKTLPENRGTKP